MAASDEDCKIISGSSTSSTTTIASSATSYGSINSATTIKIESTSDDVNIAIEASEGTPLVGIPYDVNYSESRLNQYSKRIYILPIVFLLFISTALTVASYLMWKQSKVPVYGFELSLVQHNIWSTLALPTEGLLDHNKVHSVHITHTGGESCTLPHSCRDVLKKMQKKHKSIDELNYNFIIGGDGQTYEARGWDYECGYKKLPQATTLVVAFLGNYTHISPGKTQLKSAYSLIWESIKRKKLLPSYQLYALRYASNSVTDGDGLFKEIIHWPHYRGVVQIA